MNDTGLHNALWSCFLWFLTLYYRSPAPHWWTCAGGLTGRPWEAWAGCCEPSAWTTLTCVPASPGTASVLWNQRRGRGERQLRKGTAGAQRSSEEPCHWLIYPILVHGFQDVGSSCEKVCICAGLTPARNTCNTARTLLAKRKKWQRKALVENSIPFRTSWKRLFHFNSLLSVLPKLFLK